MATKWKSLSTAPPSAAKALQAELKCAGSPPAGDNGLSAETVRRIQARQDQEEARSCFNMAPEAQTTRVILQNIQHWGSIDDVVLV